MNQYSSPLPNPYGQLSIWQRLGVGRRELFFGVGITVLGVAAFILFVLRPQMVTPPSPSFTSTYKSSIVPITFTGEPPQIPAEVRLIGAQLTSNATQDFQRIAGQLQLKPAPYSLRQEIYTNDAGTATLNISQEAQTIVYSNESNMPQASDPTLTLEQAQTITQTFLNQIGYQPSDLTLNAEHSSVGTIDESVSHLDGDELTPNPDGTGNIAILVYQKTIDSIPLVNELVEHEGITLVLSHRGMVRATIPLLHFDIQEATALTVPTLPFEGALEQLKKGNYVIVGDLAITNQLPMTLSSMSLHTAELQYRYSDQDKKIIPGVTFSGIASYTDGTEVDMSVFTPLYRTTDTQP